MFSLENALPYENIDVNLHKWSIDWDYVSHMNYYVQYTSKIILCIVLTTYLAHSIKFDYPKHIEFCLNINYYRIKYISVKIFNYTK